MTVEKILGALVCTALLTILVDPRLSDLPVPRFGCNLITPDEAKLLSYNLAESTGYSPSTYLAAWLPTYVGVACSLSACRPIW
ncbi:hypothetical protein IF1G_06721 [Cordyceps javanica]|uniref:Uncharacterized protein n=1 Tax=Cordyceps javanica TaxID=43265 RepID=A0A545VY23_9HYPO|nr:hypothetical protein IF1G_06721 [Cordyceps javanica]TQW06585.1 hypothetical protein IF2G_06007 [Cordyceps javanica]